MGVLAMAVHLSVLKAYIGPLENLNYTLITLYCRNFLTNSGIIKPNVISLLHLTCCAKSGFYLKPFRNESPLNNV